MTATFLLRTAAAALAVAGLFWSWPLLLVAAVLLIASFWPASTPRTAPSRHRPGSWEYDRTSDAIATLARDADRRRERAE